jgi:hypothetical protein
MGGERTITSTRHMYRQQTLHYRQMCFDLWRTQGLPTFINPEEAVPGDIIVGLVVTRTNSVRARSTTIASAGRLPALPLTAMSTT